MNYKILLGSVDGWIKENCWIWKNYVLQNYLGDRMSKVGLFNLEFERFYDKTKLLL